VEKRSLVEESAELRQELSATESGQKHRTQNQGDPRNRHQDLMTGDPENS